MANPGQGGVSENTSFGFYYAIYYAILFFTTLFTTLREAPANDLYVFWHIPNRHYGTKSTFSADPALPEALYRPGVDFTVFFFAFSM